MIKFKDITCFELNFGICLEPDFPTFMAVILGGGGLGGGTFFFELCISGHADGDRILPCLEKASLKGSSKLKKEKVCYLVYF